MKKNPFDKFKAKPGQKTVGETLVFEEPPYDNKAFRDAYYKWAKDDLGIAAFDDAKQIEDLLRLCIIYRFSKYTNKNSKERKKELPIRIQQGKKKAVIRAAKNQALDLIGVLSNTPKGVNLISILGDLINNPDEYIFSGMTNMPASRKDIDTLLKSLGFNKTAKEALYKLL